MITDKEIQKLLEDVLKEFEIGTILEAPGDPVVRQPQPKVQAPKPVAPRPQQKVVSRPVPKPKIVKPVAKPKPTSQTIPGPKDKMPVEKPKAYDPAQAKEKQTLSKLGYQIFNIKMRLGKLGLNDTVRRFVQSMHDFDINVTKNSKDANAIRSYLSPVQGNLVALKGALESLEAEFAELEKLMENGDGQ